MQISSVAKVTTTVGTLPGADVATVVDATGLTCPIPILRAKRALSAVAPGERVLVRSTDPDSVKDFRFFTRMKGYVLTSEDVVDGVYVFVIQK